MDVYSGLKELGIDLPRTQRKGGVYAPAKRFAGKLVYVSGASPSLDTPVTGKLGVDYTIEDGQQFARNCMLKILVALENEIGDLNKVESAVKLLVFVASDDSFIQQPQVANGASQLLVDIFDETIGLPARSAVGVNVLPGDAPVEIEALFEVKD